MYFIAYSQKVFRVPFLFLFRKLLTGLRKSKRAYRNFPHPHHVSGIFVLAYSNNKLFVIEAYGKYGIPKKVTRVQAYVTEALGQLLSHPSRYVYASSPFWYNLESEPNARCLLTNQFISIRTYEADAWYSCRMRRQDARKLDHATLEA
ncbi:MAG: hypothetical protein ACREUG_11800, partial [Steroidobacteraceae bacterium]